jgi:hypothetical protein
MWEPGEDESTVGTINPNTGAALTATQPPAANNGTATAATTPAATSDGLIQAFDRQYQVAIDTTPGKGNLSGALNDMAKILGARQLRLSDISVEIAKDASAKGTFNPLALQRLQLESTTNEQFSQLQKSIFEKMSSAISTWAQGVR